MSAESVAWQQVEAALDQVLAAEPAAQGTLLEKLCSHDPALLREVRSLLDAHEAAGEFLQTSASAFAASHLLGGAEPGEPPNTLIGHYRLVGEIGRGGMGAVWLAERADGQFSQRVALKLIKRGMDSDEILARFLRERQILARLEHPNIARLLDGGVSADGRPYFVMEYIPGVPITDYCESRQLGIDVRLRLFARICRAVQYAHRNLVVHRDLKPSNVLVTDDGEIKLLDFGVAKLLDDGESAATTTVQGASGRPMTPEYASPEQVLGGTITTASDVYQLGVVLYELLAGQRPYKVTGKSAREIEQSVCESQPSAPSTLTAGGTRHELRGDLDAIALRALRKEPEQRYPSAEALAEDVDRHLDNLPLRFGGGSWKYAAVKFLRRNRGRLAVAAILVMTLAALASGYLIQIRRERDRAREGEAKASESAALLHRFFQGWNPDAANRGEISAAKVLGDAARRAESELGNDPQTLASLLSMLGDLHSALGQTASADSLLARALTIQERLSADPSPDLAATLARLGRLFLAKGRLHEAESSLRRSLAMYRAVLPADRSEVLVVQYDLAQALWPQEKLAEAEALLRDALRKSASAAAPLATEIASMLGYVLFHEARYDEASAILRPTLDVQRRIFGRLHQSTLSTLRSLAGALRDQGGLAEAEALDREALDITRSLYGDHHVETGASELTLAIALERKGDFVAAERFAREALADAERAYGSIDFNTALRLRTLAAIRMARGDSTEAESLLRRALAGFRKTFPEGHPDEGDVLNRLVYLVVARHAPDADSIYRQATHFELSRPSTGPWFVTDGYEYLAEAARRMGDLALAERMFRRALALYERQLPEGHPYRVLAATGLSRTLAESGSRP